MFNGETKMNGNRKLLALACLVPLVSACGGDSDNDDLIIELPRAELRALHASPGAPDVDIRVNGELVLEDVSYQSASGNLSLAPGEYEVEVLEANTESVLLSETVELVDDDLISLLAANVPVSLEALVVEEDGRSVTSGNARVNVIHASPTAGTVDIYVTAYGADLPDTPSINDATFKATQSLGEVTAGEYQVRITGGSDTDVVFDSGPLTLASGANLSVVAVDTSEEEAWSPVDLVILTGSNDNPVVKDDSSFVRVVHAVPGVTVDVYVNEALTLEDFAYTGDTDGYVRLNSTPALALTLPDDAIGNAVLTGAPELERGGYYTVIANGTAADDSFPLSFVYLTDPRVAPTTAGKSNLRIVHAAPFAAGDAADVDVYAAGSGNAAALNLTAVDGEILLREDLGYQEDTGYIEVDSAAYTALVTAANDGAIAIAGETTLTAFANFTAIAVGGANSEDLELLFLLDYDDD